MCAGMDTLYRLQGHVRIAFHIVLKGFLLSGLLSLGSGLFMAFLSFHVAIPRGDSVQLVRNGCWMDTRSNFNYLCFGKLHFSPLLLLLLLAI